MTKIKLEWDEPKRQRTLRDRGLDFADLARFDWDNAETYQDKRRDYGEVRWVSVGWLRNRVVVVGWTLRGDTHRIITHHKANSRVRRKYAEFEKDRDFGLEI